MNLIENERLCIDYSWLLHLWDNKKSSRSLFCSFSLQNTIETNFDL